LVIVVKDLYSAS